MLRGDSAGPIGNCRTCTNWSRDAFCDQPSEVSDVGRAMMSSAEGPTPSSTRPESNPLHPPLPTQDGAMPGHLFIVRGDLRKLACDAWLISCSSHARPGREWFLPGYQGSRRGPPPLCHGETTRRRRRRGHNGSPARMGRCTTNSEPIPGPLLEAATNPPCNWTSDFTRARPSPSPPDPPLPGSGPCRNRSNTRGKRPGAIPRPLSRTRKAIFPASSSAIRLMCPFGGVKFAAFASRFVSTCSRRSGSA